MRVLITIFLLSYISLLGNSIENFKKIYEKNGYFIGKVNDFYGVVNKKNEIVLPFQYKEIYIHENGNKILKNQNNEYITGKNDGKMDIDKIYPSLSNYLVYEKNEKFGVIRMKDLKIHENIFFQIELSEYRYLIASNDNKKYIIIDLEEDKLKNNIYSLDYIERVGEETFIGGTDTIGKYAIIYKNFQNMTSEKYEDVIRLSDNYYLGIDNDKVELLNFKAEVIDSFRKNEYKINNNNIIIKSNGKEKQYILDGV